MAETVISPALMDAVPMCRNDSEESADSPLPSVLNTPADEREMQFDSIDGKLLSMGVPQVLGRIESHDSVAPKLPPRIALSRHFSKALADTQKNGTLNVPPFRAPERVYPQISEPSPAVHPPSPDLISFASPEMPSLPIEPPRTQTPEPTPISDAYETSSPQSIARTTPRQCPPMRRDVFSPPSKSAIIIGVGDEFVNSEPEFTPRAHSTLRHRKGMYPLLNNSITGEPTSGVLHSADISITSKDEPFKDKALNAEALAHADALSDCDDYDCDYDAPTLPTLSPLLPVQIVLFPAYCVLVGGAIFICPTRLTAIAFPASSALSFSSSSSASSQRLLSILVAACLPFTAPPTAIRSFAHWAAVAHLHALIFLAFLAGLVYISLPLGALVSGGCACLFVRAWGDFAPEDDDADEGDGDDRERGGEKKGDVLGGEVREMLYRVLLCDECGFRDGDTLRKEGDGRYVLMHRRKTPEERRREILAAGGLGEVYSGSEDEEEDEQ
ncbi:hypothetical protein B0H11DRAFT_1143637 [Mycena galericulata]|nr:hypothetical protein B0H11DRAFT_1143637 [Mycena galericulata]